VSCRKLSSINLKCCDYQSIRRSPGTLSKCRSRLKIGSPYWRQRAATIHCWKESEFRLSSVPKIIDDPRLRSDRTSSSMMRLILAVSLAKWDNPVPTSPSNQVSSIRAQSSEKQADILHQQFRLFERREMAPTGHFRPVLDIVSALDPAPGS
jgi:hypothetical protein